VFVRHESATFLLLVLEYEPMYRKELAQTHVRRGFVVANARLKLNLQFVKKFTLQIRH